MKITQTKMNFESTTITKAILATCRRPEKRPQVAVILDDQSITYEELLQKSGSLAQHLLLTHHIKMGDIIGQCFERSIDMIIGMFAILLTDAVYCPLNPDDPLERIITIIQDTQAKLVLTHNSTQSKFAINNRHFVTVNINAITEHRFSTHFSLPYGHVDPHSVAYLIHTSGSTGKPKSVQLTHDNFLNALYGYHLTNIYCPPNNRVLQVAACSFDVHVMECLGPLINGDACVMLKPHGNLDFTYVLSTIHRHQVNIAFFVPPLLYALYDHLQATNQFHLLTSMRHILVGGEACHAARLKPIFTSLSRSFLNIQLVNGYGPAETCVIATYHVVTQDDINHERIPIGLPFPNYRCYILDEQLAPVLANEIGELYIGGRGVFAGYLGDDERIESLNKAVLVQLPFENTLCYRTGDLCRLLESGDILFCGRADHQVKLRGQHLEVGEIEACILKVQGVLNCVVIKQNDARTKEDFLVAFAQSSGETDLQKKIMHQCRTHLPAYMVPSIVKVMDKLPLNVNGKIDRKQLPLVEFSVEITSPENVLPNSELERLVHAEWCTVLERSTIPTGANFFELGGNSLMLMRLLSAYRAAGLVNEEQPVTIVSLFEHTTIADHARLLRISTSSSWKTDEQWHSRNVDKARASSAQQRIWLDTQMRFSNPHSSAIYNIPLAMIVGKNSQRISVARLRRALLAVIGKHKILRTQLQNLVTESGGTIEQLVNPIAQYSEKNIFSEQLCRTESEIQLALTAEVTQQLFSCQDGQVIRCHILRCRSTLEKGYLEDGDIIIFNIHHVAFDGASRTVFFRDIQLAYDDEEQFASTIDDKAFQYIDYSIYEAVLLSDTSPTSMMNKAREYWSSTLKDCINNRLFTTTKADTNIVDSGHLSFALSRGLSTALRLLATSRNMTFFQFFLACYQLFLHKLTHQSDICVGSVSANRYRPELEQLIGMFVNTHPYRTIFKAHRKTTVDAILTEVRLLCLHVMQYEQLPFQDIVQLHRHSDHQHQLPFFQTLLLCESVSSNDIVCTFNEVPCRMIELPMSVAMYDLFLTIRYDTQSDNITGTWQYSRKLFDELTLQMFSNRFISLLSQVADTEKQQQQTIGDIHILLPHEQNILYSLNDNHVDFSDALNSCIATQFDSHAREEPTRTCVELDDKKYTYGEIRDFVNQLADHLVEQCGVQPGEIVMQCVQRSVDMVIGALAILKARAIYCPLSPDHPADRHENLIDDTQARFILCHAGTHQAFAWITSYKRSLTLINISNCLSPNSARKSYLQMLPPNKPSNCAYIIFTSGSTGKPKAVPILHSNFVACIYACKHRKIYGSRKEIVLQFSQCTFDVHVFELLGCMVIGGTLIMLKPFGNMDMDYVSRTMAEKRVTWAALTPTVIALLVQRLQNNPAFVNRLQSLRFFASCGEAAVASTLTELRQYLSSDAHICNLYGPAECSIMTTYHLVTPTNLATNIIPIGRSLPNYTCYILDEYLSPVPINTLGELYIGGPAVFPGYLGNNDTIRALNNKVLVHIRNGEQDEVFYRTGDLCRLSDDGEIVYVGRVDHQVKIRGQRLELGEVEAALDDDAVACCAVLKHVDEVTNDEYLAAYIQLKENIPVTEHERIQTRVHTKCKQTLPAFMIPTAWLIMQEMPVNSNGKIDRKQLPKIHHTGVTKSIHPSTTSMMQTMPEAGSKSSISMEDQVRDIFCRALNVRIEENEVESTLSMLGGTSLTAMTIVTLIRQRLYSSMDIGLLFEHPTVRQLTDKLTKLLTAPVQNVPPEEYMPMRNDTIINTESVNHLGTYADSDEQDENDDYTPSPSLFLETIGVILLVYHFLYPLWLSFEIIKLIPMENSMFTENTSTTYGGLLDKKCALFFSSVPAGSHSPTGYLSRM